ncbi:MAG: hypothetical protein ACQEXQ_03740 [Bacillota bacterium]
MMDKDFRIAELSSETDALDAIHKLEQQLSKQYGSDVVLIAYSAEQEEDDS